MSTATSSVVSSVERHYTSAATFMRAWRHYQRKGRRVLAYMRHAQGYTLQLEAKVST
jgi:hypothetical protein